MRSLFWVFAAVALMSGIASASLWRDLRAERQQLAALRTQLAEVAGQAPAALRSEPAPPAAVPLPVPVAAASQSAPPVTQRPVFDVATQFRNTQDQQRELWKDPEYRKARLAQIRTNLARNNPGLAEELGISQAEASRFLDVLAEFELKMNSESILFVANDPASNQEMARRAQELSRQRDEAITAQLGPKYTQWQQYQQDASARTRAASLNTMLSQAGQPLNAQQLRSLAAAVASENRRQGPEMQALASNVNPQDPTARAQVQEALRKRQEESDQRLLAATAPVMSAQQLAMLRAQFETQAATSRAMARARERAAAAQAQQQEAW